MTKLKSAKSKDERPCRKRYNEEHRWEKNKKLKIARHEKLVSDKHLKLEKRVARIEKMVLPITGEIKTELRDDG